MAISFVTYASRRRRDFCQCHAFTFTRAVHATIPRIYEMIIIIYLSIKRKIVNFWPGQAQARAHLGVDHMPKVKRAISLGELRYANRLKAVGGLAKLT